MRSVFSFLFLLHLNILVFSAPLIEFVFPDFTASNLHFIDSSDGAFLFSRNATFKAGMFSPGAGNNQTIFYFSVVHVASNAIIWSANRNSPVSSSGVVKLTRQGISISRSDGGSHPLWSTPVLPSPVHALWLTETGDLVLLDNFNVSLWESFQFPTDTVVIGQNLPVGNSLSGSVSAKDLTIGDYKFLLGKSNALMQWKGQTYWQLTMDTRAYVNSNFAVEYLTITRTGMFLMGRNKTSVIVQLDLPTADFRIAKMDWSGRFIISRFSAAKKMVTEFIGPGDFCQIPFKCGEIGLCTLDTASGNPTCSCPDGLYLDANDDACFPTNRSLALPDSCNASNNIVYLSLDPRISYFSTRFTSPAQTGSNLSRCQDLCSRNYSCFGVFYDNQSTYCYTVNNAFGSLSLEQNSPDQDLIGYVKLVIGDHHRENQTNAQPENNNKRSDFPLAALVLLPSSGLFLVCALGVICWRKCAKMRNNNSRGRKAVRAASSFSSGDLGSFRIPGLPQKFEYHELELATDHFRTQIGSGGFGAVYKGVLPDQSIVAVKKITNLGIQGRREFCTEIAVIGNIRHANLVKLRGFCARGRQLLLVYEYMNHGSLEKTLFGNGPVLEWQERFDIALGTARGLAYLHSGCDQKIIHCDVKPENILLHDHFQAKISDFGLSKLLSQDETSLFTTMRGTRGYLAPEWLTNAGISEKADVYSYGMVLLEIISGRKNCSFRSQSPSLNDHDHDHHNNGDHHHYKSNSPSSSGSGLVYFPLHALDMHEQGRYLELADPRLEGRVTNQEVEILVRIALCCVHEEPTLRPTMANVVAMLEGSTPIGQPRMESLNFLRFYGLRFAEASTMEGQNRESENMGYQRESENMGNRRGSSKGGDGTSRNSPNSGTSLSYLSSQEVSGPR